MPNRNIARVAYDKIEIIEHVLKEPVVYAIYSDDSACLYVGATGDSVSKRLLTHLRGVNTADPCIENKNPAYVLYEITEDHAALEDEWILSCCQSVTGRSVPGRN